MALPGRRASDRLLRSLVDEAPVLGHVAQLARGLGPQLALTATLDAAGRVSSRTTAASAWYWANDRLSRWWASSGRSRRTRLAAML